MIKSMTGYGNAVAENDNLKVSIEVKSLNSKFLDLNLRLPKEYSDKEFEIRNLVSAVLERGKINLILEFQQKGEAKPSVTINRPLVEKYYRDLIETSRIVRATDGDLFRIALTFPNAMNQAEETSGNSEEWGLILKTINAAILRCGEFREQEGKVLSEKLADYIARISSSLDQVETFDPKRILALRDRLMSHFEEFKLGELVDPNRFEQEMVYYVEKLDISEEKVRLRAHLEYFLNTMKGEEASGKKLGFIAQEIGREINTIGSKANDATIQRSVVEMKEELEKIKEQVLNIL